MSRWDKILKCWLGTRISRTFTISFRLECSFYSCNSSILSVDQATHHYEHRQHTSCGLTLNENFDPGLYQNVSFGTAANFWHWNISRKTFVKVITNGVLKIGAVLDAESPPRYGHGSWQGDTGNPWLASHGWRSWVSVLRCYVAKIRSW